MTLQLQHNHVRPAAGTPMLAALRSRMTAATLMSALTPARPCATSPAATAARRRVPAIQQLHLPHPGCRRGPPPASAVNGGYSSMPSATGDRGGGEGDGHGDGSAGAAAPSAPGDTAAGSVGSVAK